MGVLYSSASTDGAGRQWSPAAPMRLPNPNSKVRRRRWAGEAVGRKGGGPERAVDRRGQRQSGGTGLASYKCVRMLVTALRWLRGITSCCKRSQGMLWLVVHRPCATPLQCCS